MVDMNENLGHSVWATKMGIFAQKFGSNENENMIVDLTVSNFRSFRDEQTFSLSAERSLERHPSNFSSFEGDKIKVLRAAVIYGANASGKSNILRAFAAVRWLLTASANRKDGQSIPPYEPFRLSAKKASAPVEFEIEFIVPSGVRYRYELSYGERAIFSEKLVSYANRTPAMVFERSKGDTWEDVKFGGTYRGGTRRFPFFANSTYIARAGNDASAPKSIREIYKYFEDISYIPADGQPMSRLAIVESPMLAAVSTMLCLADTGVSKVTLEENSRVGELKFPDSMPEDLREALIAENKFDAKFWIENENGELLAFSDDDMSSGTNRLFHLLPIIIDCLESGSVLILDEVDAHLHTDLVSMLLQIFQDDVVNAKNSQLLFTTHDTNLLDPGILRRDQIWFSVKNEGVSSIKSLDEYDRSYVRHDSPFENFYRDGRLGALPQLSHEAVRDALLKLAQSDEK